MEDYCFRKLNIIFSKTNPLFEDFKNFEFKKPAQHSFFQTDVPEKYFKDEPIKEIISKYGLVPKILMLKSNYCYNWHRDFWRYVTFNMLLENSLDYLVAFSHEYPENAPLLNLREFTNNPITKLVYEPNTFYMLNVQLPHIAINYGSTDRYILSLASYAESPGMKGLAGNSTKYYEIANELTSMGII